MSQKQRSIFTISSLPWLVFVLLSNFHLSAQTPKITGHITGIGKHPILFRYEKDGQAYTDTVYAKSDHFIYKPKPTDDGTIEVFIQNPRWFSYWYYSGETMLSGSMTKPYKLLAQGGKENELLTHYNTKIKWFYDEQMLGKPDSIRQSLAQKQTQKTLDFIRQNPSSKFAAELLYWQTKYDDSQIELYESLSKNFTPAVQNSVQGKQLTASLRVIKSQPVPGKVAPMFTLSDSKGDSVALSAFKGKYVLLDFWGHWCGPCIKAFPSLKKINDQYAGKVQVIGIAAEHVEDKEKWLKAIETHKADWVQLSELQGDKGFVNTTYNIVGFPTYFLIDKKGVVISKSFSLSDIEKLLTGLNY